MPIKRTKEGGYEVSVCVRYQRVHRRLPPGTSASDAKQLEAELRRALGHGAAPVVPGDPMMNQVMALYCEHAAKLRSPETAKHHANRIEQWAVKYRASQARQCAAHIAHDMHGKYAPATINRSLGAMKAGLKLMWQQGKTPVNYGDHIKRLPENNERTVYLTMEEVRKIADQASETVRAAIWIALLTGCRRGEVCKIAAEDITETSIRIQAGNTKTLRYREVPIFPALRPWLKYLPLPINYEGLKTGFRRAREKAGMSHVHYHDLRHSCATILLAPPINAPLHVVRDILGHTSVKTTERYAHTMIEPQREALAALGLLHQQLHQKRKRPQRADVSR